MSEGRAIKSARKAAGRVNQFALGFRARAGSRGGIAFWSGAVARGAAAFFFFGFSPPLQLRGRPRRAPDRGHAGIACRVDLLSVVFTCAREAAGRAQRREPGGSDVGRGICSGTSSSAARMPAGRSAAFLIPSG